jgi:hypothetical protein
MKKPYNGLRWAFFVPLQWVGSIVILLFCQLIPIVWIVNWLFGLGEANPLKTEIVSGPIGFFYVYILYSLALTGSTLWACSITSKPKLAWKIISTVHLLPVLILLLVFEITGRNFISGNMWFNIANGSALITGVAISFCLIWSGWTDFDGESVDMKKDDEDCDIPDHSASLDRILDNNINERDVMFREAAEVLVISQQGSTYLIQRKLKIGYNRTGRIMDQLEAAGIVGPFNGSKDRSVSVPNLEDLDQLLEKEQI